ncbi:MAG: HEAT repeat domain-containing protein [Planctomycetota bacterium]|jgi:hypothetical protein
MGRLAGAAAASLLILAAPVAAQQCTCDQGNGSYLYLRAPKAPPADPDPCPAVIGGIHPGKSLPKAWNDLCWLQPRMECFLRRHAASWQISCTLCTKKKCCPFPNWRNCPECHGPKREANVADLEALEFLLKDQRKIGGQRIEMAMSPHYLLVTDIPGLKIVTARGSLRMVHKHELMHLYLQRAEQARADWTRVFGPPLGVRTLMMLMHTESRRRQFSQAAFGHPEMKLLYGGGADLAGGVAANGFALLGRDDDALHFNLRHMIGHLAISTYHTPGIHEKYLPQWIFRGAAHWLCKLHPRAKDHVFFCIYEGVETAGSGERWPSRARGIASLGPRRDPVERMFQAATAKQMTYRMHIRAWSWFDVFTQEEREPFVKFVRLLREAKEARVAAKEAFGQAPEYVDERWRERVLGKRKTVAATNRERRKEVEVDAARTRELRNIAKETDLQLLAGKIRGLERCQNVKTARLLVTLIDGRESDRVREVIALVLNRTQDAKVLAYLRGEGYTGAGRQGRATLCRVFGELGDRDARPLLRKALEDPYWLVRANGARALAQIGDKGAIPVLAEMAGQAAAAKVRIACMDALGHFGAAAKETLPRFSRNLLHATWQVKVATCAAFRAISSRAALDLLIDRIDREGGRVHDEIEATLWALTGLKRDWNSDQWGKWWTKMKQLTDLDKKMKEELKRERRKNQKKDDARRYAGPTYHGIKVYSRTIGYVLDTSLSMSHGFEASAKRQEQLGRTYRAKTRIGVCKEELAQSIGELDPRTRIHLIFFNDRVRTWQNAPVAAGAMGDQAIAAIRSVQPSGQTNYYDALRLTLGMEGAGGGWSPRFADTPDTLFFLTDGTPTDGEITKSDELLAWFLERNRFARLRVHVIAMGTTDVDVEFLRRFAKGTGGTFVHLTGRH